MVSSTAGAWAGIPNWARVAAQVVYYFKGYFAATTFNNKSGKIDAAIKSGYIRPATAFLSLPQLGELRGLIGQAKQKLDSVK
jgi:hypothetical protein